jgi:hypothetical protein
MAPFPLRKVSDDDSAGQHSFAGLMNKLDSGWLIEPPVYIMADPADRSRRVFRLVLWRNGRPHVVTLGDGPEIRQFLAERRLMQESL